MQLMLLEQQNKRRLLMAQQEQDNQSRHPQQDATGDPGSVADMSPGGNRAEADTEPTLCKLHYFAVLLPSNPENTLLTQSASVETGSHSAAVDLIGPRGNYGPPRVSDDDEMEDSGSLYRPPSSSPPPSVTVAPLAPPSPKPSLVRSKIVHVDLTTRSEEDTYCQYILLLRWSLLKLTFCKFSALRSSTRRLTGVAAFLGVTTSTGLTMNQIRRYIS